MTSPLWPGIRRPPVVSIRHIHAKARSMKTAYHVDIGRLEYMLKLVWPSVNALMRGREVAW